MIDRVTKPLREAVQPNPEGARMRGVWAVLIASTALLVWQYPDQAGVMLAKLNRVALGALLGVLLDRAIFHYARPERDAPVAEWMYRRVALMAAGMLAAALAL